MCRSHTHKFLLLWYTCSNFCSYFILHGYVQLLSKRKIRLLTLLALSRSTYHLLHTPLGWWEVEQLTQKSQWDFNEMNLWGQNTNPIHVMPILQSFVWKKLFRWYTTIISTWKKHLGRSISSGKEISEACREEAEIGSLTSKLMPSSWKKPRSATCAF